MVNRNDGRRASASMQEASPRSTASAAAARIGAIAARSAGPSAVSVHRVSMRRIARVSRAWVTPATGLSPTGGSATRCRMCPDRTEERFERKRRVDGVTAGSIEDISAIAPGLPVLKGLFKYLRFGIQTCTEHPHNRSLAPTANPSFVQL